MSNRSLSIAEARATFSEQVRSAEQGEPVIITRHGHAVAALVPIEELEALERLRAAGPEGGLASIAGGWEGSEELAIRLEGPVRRGRRGSGGEG